MASDATVQLRSLGVGEQCRVRLEAFPHSIQQFGLLGSGEAADLISQITHCYNGSAVCPMWQDQVVVTRYWRGRWDISRKPCRRDLLAELFICQ